MDYDITSEWSSLKAVAVASPELFFPTSPINPTQEREYGGRAVDVDALIAEHNSIVAVLEANRVAVLEVNPREDLPYLLNTRDAGVVVGDRYIPCIMAKTEREGEPEWVAGQIQVEGVLKEASPTRNETFEGGDIFVFRDALVVGISQRTNEHGVDRLIKSTDGLRNVILVYLAPDVLHLDTVFNVLPGMCVFDTSRITNCSELRNSLRMIGIESFIELQPNEAEQLGSNFLCLGNDHVLMSDSTPILRADLEDRGIRVESVSMTEHHRIGGSVRCMTLPLIRSETSESH